MADYERCLNLRELLEKKSFFLFGPRQTGKTTLVKKQLTSNAVVIDLLRSDTFLRPISMARASSNGSPWNYARTWRTDVGTRN